MRAHAHPQHAPAARGSYRGLRQALDVLGVGMVAKSGFLEDIFLALIPQGGPVHLTRPEPGRGPAVSSVFTCPADKLYHPRHGIMFLYYLYINPV
jgi:hypothetical protein